MLHHGWLQSRSTWSWQYSVSLSLGLAPLTRASGWQVSLDVRGKRTLEDSLDFYVQSELMEGENQYLCEAAGRKVCFPCCSCCSPQPAGRHVTACRTCKRVCSCLHVKASPAGSKCSC